MRIEMVAVPYDSGQRGARMGAGPAGILGRGIAAQLQEAGHTVHSHTVEADAGFHTEVGTSIALYRGLAAYLRASAASGEFPIVLAGNCGGTLGALGALAHEDLGLIWLDAHGDFNTPETSPSGFFDGMALAVATGQCWGHLTASIPGFRPVPPTRAVHVAGRAFDEGERERMVGAGVRAVSPEGARHDALTRALDELRAEVERVYIHLDLDALDVSEGRANEFAEPDGLTTDEIAGVFRQIAERFTVVGATLSAYDPAHDLDGRAGAAGVALLERLVAAVAHNRGRDGADLWTRPHRR